MANRNKNGFKGELPSYGQTLTVAGSALFLAASLVLYGGGNISAFGYDLANFLNTVLFSIGDTSTSSGIAVTYAHAISVLAIGAAYVGTTEELGDFTNHQGYLGVGLLASIVLTLVSPAVESSVTATTTRQILFVGAQAVAWVAMVERIEGRGWT